MNEQDEIMIIDYLNGNLSEADSKLFDKRCQEDKSFFAEVEAFKNAKLAAFLGGQVRVKDVIKDEAQIFKQEQNREAIITHLPEANNFKLWIWRSVAAAFLVGVGLWGFKTFGSSKMDTEGLFADNFKALQEIPITRFRSDGVLKIDSAFKLRHDAATLELAVKALDFYSKPDYPASIEVFNQIKVSDDTLSLCKATALLGATRAQEAQILLSKLAQNGKGYTKPFAQWYLAMSLLKQGNKVDFMHALQTIISTPNHPYLRDAQRLLAQVVGN
jgi:hypothetical protein